MTVYYDSSVILSLLLGQEQVTDAVVCWENVNYRVSSLLLKFEVITVLRRHFSHRPDLKGSDWLIRKTEEAEELFRNMYFSVIDSELYTLFRNTPGLARCRSLDALHIASALQFRQWLEDKKLFLASYDHDMQELAGAYGFPVRGKGTL